MKLHDSSDLLEEINRCLITLRQIERELKAIWKKVVPGQDLKDAVKENLK